MLKKEVPIVWNEQYLEAFKKIKNYLMKPPILVPPIPEKPLLQYLTTTDTAMGALLAQYLEESKKENAIYYISKEMMAYKEKYSALEKTCVGIVLGYEKTQTLHACFQSIVDSQNGSLEIYDENVGAR